MALQSQLLEYNSEVFKHYFLCNYRPKSAGSDELSKSLICFKKGWILHVDAWTECTISALRVLNLGKESLILRVLNSDEELVSEKSNTSLDTLCRKTARKFKTNYMPGCLTKTRNTRKMKFLTKQEREAEMINAYSFDLPEEIDGIKELFIIDDILTSGVTMCEVIRSIRDKLPDISITLFTLASTDQHSRLNETITLNSYSYEWQPVTGWNVVAEEEMSYGKLDDLRNKILNDQF